MNQKIPSIKEIVSKQANKRHVCKYCGEGMKIIPVPVSDKTWHFAVCPNNCAEKKNREFEQGFNDNQSRMRYESLKHQSNIDAEYYKSNYPISNEKFKMFYDDIDLFVKTGSRIILWGEPGRGKTTMVCKMLISAMKKLYSVKYFRASELANNWRIDDTVRNCAILCLDNLFMDDNEANRNLIFDLTDHRKTNNLAMIYITNKNEEQAKQIFSAPMLSRLIGDFIPIDIEGNIDYRDGQWENSEFGKKIMEKGG